jgi:hypothetical protein
MGLLQQVPFLEPYPSHANFILCKVAQGRDAKAVKDALAQQVRRSGGSGWAVRVWQKERTPTAVGRPSGGARQSGDGQYACGERGTRRPRRPRRPRQAGLAAARTRIWAL